MKKLLCGFGGFFIYDVDGKICAYNGLGELLTDRGFVVVDTLIKEKRTYYKVEANGKAGIVDEEAEVVVPIEFDDVLDNLPGANKSGLKKVIVVNDKEQFIYDIESKKIVTNGYTSIEWPESSNVIGVEFNGYYGVLDENFNEICKPEYKVIGAFPSFNTKELIFVIKDTGEGYINKKGEEIIPIVYKKAFPVNYITRFRESIIPDEDTIVVCTYDNLYGLYDSSGNIIIEPKYANIIEFISVKKVQNLRPRILFRCQIRRILSLRLKRKRKNISKIPYCNKRDINRFRVALFLCC